MKCTSRLWRWLRCEDKPAIALAEPPNSEPNAITTSAIDNRFGVLFPELSSEQQRLLQALSDRSEHLAAIYSGALYLQGSAIPDALALSAHGFRELMIALPTFLNVPMPAHRERITDKLPALQKKWARSDTIRLSATNPELILGTLTDFHLAAGELFAWYDVHKPRRDDEVRNAFRAMDVTGSPTAPDIEKTLILEWSQLRDFFNSIAHHGRTVSLADFLTRTRTLERLLLDKLRPPVLDDREQLSALIAEGEIE